MPAVAANCRVPPNMIVHVPARAIGNGKSKKQSLI
jgi:hypothetical protein